MNRKRQFTTEITEIAKEKISCPGRSFRTVRNALDIRQLHFSVSSVFSVVKPGAPR